MFFSRVHLTLLIGPTVPIPAAPTILEDLESVVVTHNDEGRSGFQITFKAGRGGLMGAVDYPLMLNPMIKVFNRIVLVVTLGIIPEVLMDGIITNIQLNPGNNPSESTLTLTGEDVSVMMDLQEKQVEHPGQDETAIATKIIGMYSQYGLIPMVIPPKVPDQPLPADRVPVQQGTDRDYLEEIAKRHGYVFYIIPGPSPLSSIAYWGPPVRVGVPQRALSLNMGAYTNVNNIDFQYDGLAPVMISGKVQDRETNVGVPVQTYANSRLPLASQPAWLVNQPYVRTRSLEGSSGLNATQAYARAQAETDASSDSVLRASGELDGLRYGMLLKSRATIGLRGAGYQHDGLYYVKNVTHNIRDNGFKQQFVLTREGLGSTTPAVIP